jgi:hypothetical protein
MAMRVPRFRPPALDHCTAPAPRDPRRRAVRPQPWLALATCAALGGMTVRCGLSGHFPNKAMGRDVLIRAADGLSPMAQEAIRRPGQAARTSAETLLAQDRAQPNPANTLFTSVCT